MKLFNYEVKYGQSAYFYLDHLINLTEEQKEKLGVKRYGSHFYDDMPFDILIYKKSKPINFWLRLSKLPFYLLELLFVLFLPIKYLITGNSTYNLVHNKYFKWFWEWGRKIHEF